MAKSAIWQANACHGTQRTYDNDFQLVEIYAEHAQHVLPGMQSIT